MNATYSNKHCDESKLDNVLMFIVEPLSTVLSGGTVKFVDVGYKYSNLAISNIIRSDTSKLLQKQLNLLKLVPGEVYFN